MREFELSSDRVRQWVDERCDVHALPESAYTIESHRMTPGRVLAQRFNWWAQDQGGAKMGERKFFTRLTCIDGVREVRSGRGGLGPIGVRGYNITARPDDPVLAVGDYRPTSAD